MEEELVRNIRNRLHRVIGHMASVDEMIAGKREMAEILNQLLAIHKANHNLIYQQFDKLLRLNIVQRLDALLITNPNLSPRLEAMHEIAFRSKQAKAFKGTKNKKHANNSVLSLGVDPERIELSSKQLIHGLSTCLFCF